jgi:predicted phage tail protein
VSTLIAGAGGGGGKGGGKAYNPTTARDGLDSGQYAKVIDLISEGEIEGLKDGHKSIYINNTPLQNADGTYNFQNVSVYTTNGTQNQAAIPISDEINSEIGVQTPVLTGLPVVKSITRANVDAARITISIPQLQSISDKGDINGTSVRLQIALQYAGGGFTTVVDDTISGRTGDLYQKDYIVNFTGSRPVDIRVTRITPDSADPRLTNAFSWASYTEITYAKLRYPNSALVGLRIDAEQFNSIPSRSYLVRGIKVRIPSNATVDPINGRLIYAGMWDGTFAAAAWTTDPCFILYDLLTSTRYGFGDYIQNATLDKWAFYSASQYSSALVDSGRRAENGSVIYEPRFSCNVNIQTQEEAFKLINDLVSVFRAQAYWSAGSLTISQDKPSDAAYLFTLANVIEGGFTYQNSSKKTRATVAVVSYLDLGYYDPVQAKWIDGSREVAYEAVEDAPAIAKYGVLTTQVSAFACTSRGQANRIGKWLLFAENYESETVAFVTSLDAGVIVRPGQVIEIADPMRAGSRRGGRIRSATTTSITVDDATFLTTANSPTLSVILSDGAVQTRAVTNIAGNAITVGSAFTSAPLTNSIWIFESTDLQTSTWRVLGVAEQEQSQYAITAIAYNATKYANIEDGTPLQFRDTTNLNEIPDAPTDLSFNEVLYTNQAEVRSKIIVTWKPVVGVNQYEVRWRKDLDNWTISKQPSLDFELLNITPGLFDFKIYSLNAGGKPSVTPLTGSIAALGKTAPPSDVTTFSATLDPDVGVTLNWEAITDLDLQGYEIWQGESWDNGIKLGLFAATSKKLGLVAPGTTTWWIKALDTSGVYSETAISASLTIVGAPAPSVNGQFAGENFTLSWDAVNGDLATAVYDIRYGATSDTYATATLLGTVKATTFTTKWDPSGAPFAGTRRFFVAAVDLNGTYGTSNYVDAVVIPPGQPTIGQQVIDNNVLLQWNDCTQTLPISVYELRKGATWAGATVIGTKQGKFTTVFETTAGTYTYWLAGIDSAGNYGTPGSISAQVNQPPDYILKLDQNSTFSGTKTNLATEDGKLYATVNTTETWQSHFTSRSWTTPQDQITAGYAYYAMPTETTGQYTETIDYGAVLAGTRVSTTLTSNNIVGSVAVTPAISVKKFVGDAWTVYAGVSSVFVTDFQFVRIQYDFVSTGNNDILEITNINTKLDAKLRTDSGSGTANSGDSGGTTVTFNIPFIDVDSISVTAAYPGTSAPVIAIYNFTDTANPTTFKVLLYDTAGSRVNGGFSWSARGV